MRSIEVSVVIPCLNEAQSIASCVDKAVRAFHEHGIRGEVVVGDNGSTDGSQDIAREHGARVVHAERKGYGHALRAAIQAAQGAFLVMGDADDSYDFSQVPRFVEKWREGFEVVMGNRFLGGIRPGAMPWHHRYIGNPVLTALLNLFFRSGIGDAHCGLRGFTRDVYDRMDLRTTGMEFASEFVIKAVKVGARMCEIPIVLWPDRRGRPPHLRSFRDGWRHLRFMLLYAPNWTFLAPGGFLLALGVGLVVWLWPQARWIGGVRLDVHTMLFGMIFALLGMQIVSIGFFAKVFSYSESFSPREHALERWLKRVRFEHGLVAGLILALIGFGSDVRIFLEWAGGGFGKLAELRSVIFWSLWFFLGVQIVFASFFLSMLGVSRGTYIGDKDFL